jgi:hypothetical protein
MSPADAHHRRAAALGYADAAAGDADARHVPAGRYRSPAADPGDGARLAFGDFPDTVTLVGMLVIVGGGLLAVNWQQMRRLTDVSDQSGTH